MGYIRELEQELREMLTDLPEEKIAPVIKFVKEKVYDSYQNGQAGKAKKQEKDS
jgi:hypothetical protein